MLNDPLDFEIRPLTTADEPLLWDMLYQALQSGDEGAAPSREIIHQPDFARYVEEWGREGDVGFVAFDRAKNQPIGAVWCRASLEPAGTAAEDVAELAFSVRSGYRRHGVGAALLTQWVRANPQQSAVKFRVSSSSPAVRLYERFGFKVTEAGANSVTLRREA